MHQSSPSIDCFGITECLTYFDHTDHGDAMDHKAPCRNNNRASSCCAMSACVSVLYPAILSVVVNGAYRAQDILIVAETFPVSHLDQPPHGPPRYLM